MRSKGNGLRSTGDKKYGRQDGNYYQSELYEEKDGQQL
jgi:hypothetical protein